MGRATTASIIKLRVMRHNLLARRQDPSGTLLVLFRRVQVAAIAKKLALTSRHLATTVTRLRVVTTHQFINALASKAKVLATRKDQGTYGLVDAAHAMETAIKTTMETAIKTTIRLFMGVMTYQFINVPVVEIKPRALPWETVTHGLMDAALAPRSAQPSQHRPQPRVAMTLTRTRVSVVEQRQPAVLLEKHGQAAQAVGHLMKPVPHVQNHLRSCFAFSVSHWSSCKHHRCPEVLVMDAMTKSIHTDAIAQ
jgi:hypothetical protein